MIGSDRRLDLASNAEILMQSAGPWRVTIADILVFTCATALCLAVGMSCVKNLVIIFAFPYFVVLPVFAVPMVRGLGARRHLDRVAATSPAPGSRTGREFEDLDRALWAMFGVISTLVVGLAAAGEASAMAALIVVSLLLLLAVLMVEVVALAPCGCWRQACSSSPAGDGRC